MQVLKRNGTLEFLDIDKLHKVVDWACEGIDGVSTSEVEAKAQIKFFDGIKTSDVHQSLIVAAQDLIYQTPAYDLVAGRLLMFDIRKNAYGCHRPLPLEELVKLNTERGVYSSFFLDNYTKEQFKLFDSWIDHSRDFDYRIAGAREWESKYLNKYNGSFVESPQIAYMLISMLLFNKYIDEFGIGIIKTAYDVFSTGKVSLPSPIMRGVRTNKPQGASCVVIEAGDSLDSISATTSAILKYASNKAGLGVGVYNLRADGRPIRNGDAYTTGVIPFAKLMQAAIASCSQGGMRKGSGTFQHFIFHEEVESLLVLKNNKGIEENRIRGADHSFAINSYLWRKILSNHKIALFSPEQHPDLFKAFAEDQELFAELYEKYSETATKFIQGSVLRDMVVSERASTSRVYLFFIDNVNNQGVFKPKKAPVKQSNLCLVGDTEVLVRSNGIISSITLENLVNSNEEYEILSYNIETGDNEFKKVTDKALTAKNATLVKVKYAEHEIICTPDHKVYTKNRGYVEAKNLLAHDELVIK